MGFDLIHHKVGIQPALVQRFQALPAQKKAEFLHELNQLYKSYKRETLASTGLLFGAAITCIAEFNGDTPQTWILVGAIFLMGLLWGMVYNRIERNYENKTSLEGQQEIINNLNNPTAVNTSQLNINSTYT